MLILPRRHPTSCSKRFEYFSGLRAYQHFFSFFAYKHNTVSFVYTCLYAHLFYLLSADGYGRRVYANETPCQKFTLPTDLHRDMEYHPSSYNTKRRKRGIYIYGKAVRGRVPRTENEHLQ